MIARIYGALLRLVPSGFRGRYGLEMQQTFEEEWSELRGAARIGFVIRSYAGLVWSAFVIRVHPGYAHSRALSHSDAKTGVLAGIAVDARAALRGLVRRPGFSVTSIATVGLGMGAAIAVFAVVDAAVFRGLALPNVQRVMWVTAAFERSPGQEFALSAAEYSDIASEMSSFEAVGGWSGGTAVLEPLDDRPARTMNIAFTNGAVYRIAGARTVVGRLPSPDEDRLGAEPVAVISHRLWISQYAGDSGVVHAGLLRVGRADVRIIGVLAPHVALPGIQYEAWIHRVLDPATWAANRSGHGINTVALLRPGMTESAAGTELAALQRTWGVRYAGQHSLGIDGHGGAMQPVSHRWLGTARRVGLLLAAAAGALLLLACANVANLLLARGETRAAEAGVRTALGATARRVAQPVVIEGVMIALAGTGLGLSLAALALPVFMRLAPSEITGATPAAIDLRVVAFAVATAFVTSAAFSWLPAWSASRRNVSVLLRNAGRWRSAGLRSLRVLVGAQTALATVLLIGAGLFVQSLRQLNSVDSGFDRRGRIAFDVVLPSSTYADSTTINSFYAAARHRLEALDGVQRFTVIQNLPLRNPQRPENVLREGQTDVRDAVGLSVQVGGTGVLRTMGIPLVEGRDFDDTDRADGIRVALINRSAARVLWPGEWAPTMRNLTVVAQTSRDPSAIMPAALAAIRGIDAFVPVQSPTTMEDVVRASAGRERFLAAMLVVFAALALSVAAIGVFGVVSFTVARQTRELAIRSALGGGNTQIFREVVRTNAGVAAAGAVLGAVVAALVAPSVSALLYHVAPRDATLLLVVPIGLIGVAVVACIAPATRVMRVPLMRALGGSD